MKTGTNVLQVSEKAMTLLASLRDDVYSSFVVHIVHGDSVENEHLYNFVALDMPRRVIPSELHCDSI